ncbi:biotin-dependent carboxyltransferase family protein [Pedobacter deserti]|uniref:5-oxoprolinase subunit C family protein n=1 Tax=Pedobacter deserti TaxID=2817382 RepID=UPI00210C98FA|nr:biotin-dependent carboxyltransferase family protein [Pedobacter sp. SYSU D00382]
MGIRVLKSGLLTTIQDTGRHGYRRQGIIVSGAMDSLALRIGNMLVGNNEDEAAIECSVLGPSLYFEESTLIAITGGDLSASVDGRPLATWRPVLVQKGATLSFGKPNSGCRAYVCISGGLNLPKILSSRSTYLKARIGGWQGRALQVGDCLPFRSTAGPTLQGGNWSLHHGIYPDITTETVRVTEGPEYSLFRTESLSVFTSRRFQISSLADRMGYRMWGEKLLLNRHTDMLSEAVAFGTIQVPPDGDPIILMADHQTTGGYPRIAQVITADQSILAQKQSGQFILFKMVSLAEAHAALKDTEGKLRQLRQTLSFKFGGL